MLLQVLRGNEAKPEEKISIEDDVGKAMETAQLHRKTISYLYGST